MAGQPRSSDSQHAFHTQFGLLQPYAVAGLPITFAAGSSVDLPAPTRYAAGLPPHLDPLVPILFPLTTGPMTGTGDMRRQHHLQHFNLFPFRSMSQFDRDAAALAEGMERLQLNPMAKEFVPPRGGRRKFFNRNRGPPGRGGRGGEYAGGGGRGSAAHHATPSIPANTSTSGRGSGSQGGGGARGQGRKGNATRRKSQLQQSLEGNIKRTVYVCDVDQQVTEEQLLDVFADCGQIRDCRICGDPNSSMRFAFIEFADETASKNALNKSGTLLGAYELRVMPSKTAIVPVKDDFLPRTAEEREAVSRTVYLANIDKRLDRDAVKAFFEQLCGPVAKIRLLGDFRHSTRIAFLEFASVSSARAALNCSGALLGTMPIRVSPSKTPVRVDSRTEE